MGEKRDGDAPTRLLCDAMLGKLSRELRMAGVDADYSRGMSGMRAYRRARSQQRVLVTRSNRLRELPGVMFVGSSKLEDQLAEVRDKLGIEASPDKELTRCLRCNEPLETLTREQARPHVPFFVYQIHHDFKQCKKCKRVYWPGSHSDDMSRRLTAGRTRGRRRR